MHHRLDATVGAFNDLGSYSAFLLGSLRFRQSIEPALPDHADWQPQRLLPALREDLADLGLRPDDRPPPPLRLATASARLGALYVLEGSAIGARLLFQRATALGLTERHGARHLARQAADRSRWPAFLALLETTTDIDRLAAVSASRLVFDTALTAYSGASIERV